MYYKYFKRIIDISLAFIGLPLLGLVFIFIAPIIYLEDKGPIFYNANRLGINGKIFKMYKFRTMKKNTIDIRNNDGSTYNCKDDNRMTKIGRVLRNSSLDEAPQIINVIKNEMSIIGPRPDLPDQFILYNDYEKRKLDIKPGITGYNQAYYRNNTNWKKRIINDIKYIDNISIIIDIKIFYKTILTVFKRENIYNV